MIKPEYFCKVYAEWGHFSSFQISIDRSDCPLKGKLRGRNKEGARNLKSALKVISQAILRYRE